MSGGRARQHDQVISKQSYRGAARKLLSYSMQQRYLLTPGGQRLYSAAKLDVEWGNIFFYLLPATCGAFLSLPPQRVMVLAEAEPGTASSLTRVTPTNAIRSL